MFHFSLARIIPWPTGLVLALMLIGGEARAQPARLEIPRVDRAPRLVDFVEGRPREAETLVEAFVQRDPNDGEPASQPTRAYLSYDSRNLYAAFVCVDAEPARVRARLSKRDTIAQDDQVVLFLDTFHDRQRAYLFAVNPLGVQADGISSEGRDDDYSFDAVWRAEGRATADGFVVLMAIPFKSLRIAATDDATWGVAVSRIIPRHSEQSFWPPVTRKVEGLLQQFATLERPPRVSGGRNLQLIPYSTFSAGRYLDLQSGRHDASIDRRFGLDGKMILRDTVALDLAVRPDFSQVESDQPQVAVNQRFELFYPEKRPFFLENASFFKYVRTAPSDPTTRNVPEMLFFSRRLQNLDAGARVTGKLGTWSFGAIAANDRGVGSSLRDDDGASVAVGRVQREFRNQSTLGVFLTSRARFDETNHVAALDLRWKLSPNWVFAGQAVASRTARPARSTGILDVARDGSAYNASLFYNSRHALYSVFYSDRSPSFRASLGFVPRTDIRQIENYGEYRWRPRRGAVLAYGPNGYVRLNWDHLGRLQEWIVRFPFEVHLQGRTQVFVRRVESYELFQNVALRGHVQTINVTSEWLKWLAITEGFEWGVSPNYFPAAGASPHLARSMTASLGLVFRPTPRVRYEQTYLHGGLAALPMSNRDAPVIFNNHIARSTVNFQFTRELSVRTIVDYNAVIPNPALVGLVNDKRIGIDTLLTYQVGPATALYIGYTSGFQNVSVSQLDRPVARIASPTTLVGRQVLVKVSYLFRS